MERWKQTHHTMMVHTTHSVSQMGPLAKLIDITIKGWSNLIWDDFDQIMTSSLLCSEVHGVWALL